MNFHQKQIKINALQSIILQCRRYNNADKKWRIYVSDCSGSLDYNHPLYGCMSNGTDKQTIRTMLDCYISLAKQTGIYFPVYNNEVK